MSSQQLYTVEEVLTLVHSKFPQCMRLREDVDTVFLRFENEWVSVYSQSELRLAVELVVIYHNKLVTEHLQHEKDLNGKSYGEVFHTPEFAPQTDLSDNNFDDAESFASCDSVEQVLDPEYEANQDLVPWKQECGRWYKSLEEKFGFYI